MTMIDSERWRRARRLLCHLSSSWAVAGGVTVEAPAAQVELSSLRQRDVLSVTLRVTIALIGMRCGGGG